MANQITIDIVAETKKLTSGINDANTQIDGMSSKLKGAAAAAGAAASAFLIKEGVTFLKQGIDEAKEAQETMRAATATFGEGSAALKKITEDATKFGKEIAVDNDTILKLSVQLGSRLPEDSKALSAELVNLAFDVQAFTGGALDAETVTNKLAKALADGELKAADLEKIVPGLTDAQYKQAEAASKAGDNQKALTLIIEAAQAKYGDAAEKNVTATQKFDKALADLKEQVGTQVLPIVEKFIGGLTTLLEWFDKQPDAIKKIEIALGILLTAGALTLTFLASMKTSLVTLGIVNGTTAGSIGLVTVATNLLKIALAGLGIGLVIAAIVLLVQNWDKVTEAVGKLWEMIKDVVPKAWNKVMEFKDKVVGFVKNIVDAYLSIPGKMLDIGRDIVEGLWNGMKGMLGWLTDRVKDLFGGVINVAKKAFGIKSPSKVFAGIGKNIAQGFWTGVQGQETYLKRNLDNFFTNIIPTIGPEAIIPNFKDLATLSDVADAVSNSSVDQSQLAGVGIDWNAGTEQFDIDNTVVTTDMLYGIMTEALGSPVVVNINAAPGTDLYSLGRTVNSAINKYSRISTQYGVKQQL